MSDESTEREEHESRRRDTFTLSREAARAVWKKAEETGKRPAEILNDLVGQHLEWEERSTNRDGGTMFTLSREARRAVWEKAEETGKWPAEILNDLVGQHLGVGGAKR